MAKKSHPVQLVNTKFMYPGLQKLAKNEVCDFFENSCTRVYRNWRKMKFVDFVENSCTWVYGNWPKIMSDIFLKIHVPGSTEIGKK